jgi:hypothetical protein
LAMGLRPSPYLAYQGALRLRESLHEDEVFAWDSVRMNLPGSHAFDPSLPWVSKIMKDGSIAVDTHIFVDDVMFILRVLLESSHGERPTLSEKCARIWDCKTLRERRENLA